MEYISDITSIKKHHLIFKMPIKNQNNKYIYYYKLLYSDALIHLKYLLFRLDFTCVDLHGKVQLNDPVFASIRQLELTILRSINQSANKQLNLSLYTEITHKDIYQKNKQMSNQPLFLKISGIWEDKTHIGIVYKLYYSGTTYPLEMWPESS